MLNSEKKKLWRWNVRSSIWTFYVTVTVTGLDSFCYRGSRIIFSLSLLVLDLLNVLILLLILLPINVCLPFPPIPLWDKTRSF